MNTPSKKKKIIIRLIVVGVLTAIFLNPISLMVYDGLYGNYVKMRALRDPNVYVPVGDMLALYCQSYPLLKSLFKPEHEWIVIMETTDFAWIPKEMRDLGLGSYGESHFYPDYSSVKIGDGYTYNGYTLSLDAKASTSTTNVWQLSLRRQGFFNTRHRHLATFPMDVTRQLAPDKLLARLAAEYDTIIYKETGIHIESRRRDAWVEKIRIHLMFDRFTEAQVTLHEMRDAMPDEWECWLHRKLTQEELDKLGIETHSNSAVEVEE